MLRNLRGAAASKNGFLLAVILAVAVFGAIQTKAQDIETTAIDAAGLKKIVSDAKGKPLLINFWATWCGPCRAEFPDLVKIDADYRKKGLEFVLVSVDNVGIKDTLVPEFLGQYGAKMPSYLIDLPSRKAIAGAVRKIYPNFRDAYPLTLLFDKNGRLAYQKMGRIDDRLLRKQIAAVLKK